MWKAFDEMKALGWIGSERPRIVVVQAEGCAPIVLAFHTGGESAPPWPDEHTIAAGLRVPSSLGSFLILKILRASDGAAVSVSDNEIIAAQNRMAKLEGVSACPEGGATLATLEGLIGNDWVSANETVLLFNMACPPKTGPR